MKKINADLTDEEYKFLIDVLGHTNYDVEESGIYSSLWAKITL